MLSSLPAIRWWLVTPERRDRNPVPEIGEETRAAVEQRGSAATDIVAFDRGSGQVGPHGKGGGRRIGGQGDGVRAGKAGRLAPGAPCESNEWRTTKASVG